MRRIFLILTLVFGLGLVGSAGVMALADRGFVPSMDVVLAAIAPPAPQAPEIDGGAIETAWSAWRERHDIEASSMAVGAGGAIVHVAGAGREAAQPYPVMSLSKAITALCMTKLLDEARLTWNASLGGIADVLSAAGVTPPDHAAAITLAQLVTHTSGMAPDITQGTMRSKLHGSLGLHRRIGFQAMQRENLTGVRGDNFYANSNYALLGAIIEGLSGRGYGETCKERILHPAGIHEAIIEGASGSMSSYAGWEMSAEDYARLAMHWFNAARPWVLQPGAYPAHDGYGLGARIAGAGRDAVISHTGRFCSGGNGTDNGAIFVATGAGAAFVANWDGCVDARAYADLERAVTRLLD
ncbi:serine hydrolase domain-containing protein [Anianabacter salinae]|uniref:serine hydrolase domain-containing protein n=1 Tax=Anianabacter salinae TaxID=2851023 RepID=UPI00225E4140|nr:serine hydrolase domain-containing protein [Anianabacter salinae]MBV0911382.1 beta-lactamase family protein [Anianabacter salinae]